MYILVSIKKHEIVKSSFGDSQNRPPLNIKITLNEKPWNPNITSTQRSMLSCLILTGGKTLKGENMINSKKYFVLSEKL